MRGRRKRVHGILDDDEVVTAGEVSQGEAVHRHAGEVNGHDRSRPTGDRCLGGDEVDAQRLWIHVDENGGAPEVGHDHGGRCEGPRGTSTAAPGATPARLEREMQACLLPSLSATVSTWLPR